MALERIVFHCADQDLFDLFIRSLPRPVLLDPLRNDPALQKKYFRGYRISKSSPDVPALCKAYHKEINKGRNDQLLDYLCRHWVFAHPELAEGTLERLGLSGVDLRQIADWLYPAHELLAERGHIEFAAEVTRALAFDYPLEEILTVLSVLSVDYENQRDLRRCIEREFQKAHDDPGYLHAALTEHQTRLMGRLDHIAKQRSDEESRCQAALKPIANELTRLSKKRTHLQGEGLAREEALQKAKKRLDQAQAHCESANAMMREWTVKHDKLERSTSHAQAELQEHQYSRDAVLADLDRQKSAVETDLADILERLQAAKHRMLRAQHDVGSGAAAGDATTSGSDTPRTQEACVLSDVLEFVARLGFIASPLTVDVFRVWLQDRRKSVSAPPRHADYLTDPTATVDYCAHMTLHAETPWDAGILGNYALARSFQDVPDDSDPYERRTDILLGGLYHAERTVDSDIVERLLSRLIELVPDGGDPSPGRLDLFENLEILAQSVTNGAVARRFGALQTKLATANPRALQQLYDQMSPGLRVQAKRALLSRIKGPGLQDTDPTHEVLDVVTTHLVTLLGPLGSARDAWTAQATLQDEVRMSRQTLLATTAKLLHVFSPVTNDRLAQFRELFGSHLKETLAADTLDGYELFRRLLLQYCLRESRQPEWVSSRYLFPIIVSLADVASRADHKIRQRKADIRLALEKQQHPLHATGRGVPLRIQLENTGTATASDIHVEMEADRQEVTIRPRHYRLAKLGPEDEASCDVAMDVADPVSVVELACLYHWQDPSGGQRVGDQTLKLTAQRDVQWEKARVNPYSLRSITSQERLVGRDADLETLRIGIEGTQSYCITGQKRVGKTSVARVLLREFQNAGGHVAVYLTFGDLVAGSWPEVIYSLYEAIGDEMEDVVEGSRLELPSVEEFVEKQSRYNRAFLRELGRALGGMRVLCIIDDFDEIDEDLYKGAEAKELFLRLRTLIDRGDFSFVMVGSEKLPDVLRHQGERLNQVQQHSLNYFREKASLRRLVVEPALPYLEYSDEAIDEIWEYSAGNPYYATQICIRVYGDMVSRRDHYVSPSDVQRSVDAICDDSNVSTFQHFWTDGVFEGGLDMARLQYLNATILSACARHCAKQTEHGIERQALLAEPSLGSYDPAQARFRLDNLVDRGVLVETAGRVGLRVPLFERWLLTRGEAAVRASFGGEDLEVRLAPTVVRPASRTIVELTRNLVYQGQPLSEDRVRTWLDQFGPVDNQKLALRLLERLRTKGYYSEASVHSGCKTLHQLTLGEFASAGAFAKIVEKRRIKNVFVTHFEGDGRSGGRVLHVYRNANALAAGLVGSMDEAVTFVEGQQRRGRECAVVFVDDFVGTGGSCVEGLKVFRGKLDAHGGAGDRLVVGVATLLALRAGVETVRANEYVDCIWLAGDLPMNTGREWA